MQRLKVSIMQPYFFPYLGYFSLIKHTDRFILLDEVQFIRHGWIERNRILKLQKGWIYIKAPLKRNGRGTLIKECLIDNSKAWKDRIINQCAVYKKIAPYYFQTINLLKGIFEREFNCITSQNQHILKELCCFLGFERTIDIFSKMELVIHKPNLADDWALNICKKLGNEVSYYNPLGGKVIFDQDKYRSAGVELLFHSISENSYRQYRNTEREFEPSLSILDVLMFNSKSEINSMLDNYVIQ